MSESQGFKLLGYDSHRDGGGFGWGGLPPAPFGHLPKCDKSNLGCEFGLRQRWIWERVLSKGIIINSTNS